MNFLLVWIAFPLIPKKTIIELINYSFHLLDKMIFGFTKKQLIGWGLLATGFKVVFGIWLLNQLGFNLPW